MSSVEMIPTMLNTLSPPMQTDLFNLPADLQARIKELVGAEEQLVWVGQPVAWRRWITSLAASLSAVVTIGLFVWITGAARMLERAPMFVSGAFAVMVLLMVALPTIIVTWIE